MGGSGKGGGSTGPTAAETSLASIATQSFQRQQQVYQPVIDKYVKQAGDVTSIRNQTRGLSNVSTEQSFGKALPTAVATDYTRGAVVDPATMSIGKTQSKALGGATAVGAGTNVALSREESLLGFGRGTATQATTGLGQVAGAEQQQAELDAERAANSRAQMFQFGIGAAGLGAGLASPTSSSGVHFTPYNPTPYASYFGSNPNYSLAPAGYALGGNP
jgi:hypothetical protein